MEKLLDESAQQGVLVFERRMSPNIKGLYGDGIIWLNRDIATTVESTCILAEELGHFHTSAGNILDQRSHQNRKQERRARQWAYERLVPLQRIIDAYHARVKDKHELAEFLGVTELFLLEAIARYKEIHGVCYVKGQYVISFEPLRVFEFLF